MLLALHRVVAAAVLRRVRRRRRRARGDVVRVIRLRDGKMSSVLTHAAARSGGRVRVARVLRRARGPSSAVGPILLVDAAAPPRGVAPASAALLMRRLTRGGGRVCRRRRRRRRGNVPGVELDVRGNDERRASRVPARAAARRALERLRELRRRDAVLGQLLLVQQPLRGLPLFALAKQRVHLVVVQLHPPGRGDVKHHAEEGLHARVLVPVPALRERLSVRLDEEPIERFPVPPTRRAR